METEELLPKAAGKDSYLSALQVALGCSAKGFPLVPFD